jgi:hypothetical protein
MAKRKTSDQDTLKHFTTYAAPPAGFDMQRAPARMLYKHGIPRRPDAIKEPHLQEIWERAFESKPTFIKAEIEIDYMLSKRKRPVIARPEVAAVGQPSHSKKFSPSGWAGVVKPVNFNPPEPAVSVYGEWFIPTVTPIPNQPAGPQTVGFWVGLDGFGNNQVLQAGSAATITGTSVDYWVWTEWFPIGAIRVTNFPIKPGDYLTVLVCANQPNHGFCTMLNKTTNQATSIGITPPGGVTSIGATAEWIVEGISPILPVFSSVVFANCSAGTKNHAFNMNGGIVTEITGTGGANLTTAGILSDKQGIVKWLNAK